MTAQVFPSLHHHFLSSSAAMCTLLPSAPLFSNYLLLNVLWESSDTLSCGADPQNGLWLSPVFQRFFFATKTSIFHHFLLIDLYYKYFFECPESRAISFLLAAIIHGLAHFITHVCWALRVPPPCLSPSALFEVLICKNCHPIQYHSRIRLIFLPFPLVSLMQVN